MSDNRAIQIFIVDLLQGLKENVTKYLRKELKGILVDQRQIAGGVCYLHGGIIYQELFLDGHKTLIIPASAKPLHPSLVSRHVAWLDGFKAHEKDWKRVTQTVHSIKMRTDSLQDIRDMFPDVVLDKYLKQSQFAFIDRTRPDLYSNAPAACQKFGSTPEEALELRLVHWDHKLINMYNSVGATIDRYIGYSYL